MSHKYPGQVSNSSLFVLSTAARKTLCGGPGCSKHSSSTCLSAPQPWKDWLARPPNPSITLKSVVFKDPLSKTHLCVYCIVTCAVAVISTRALPPTLMPQGSHVAFLMKLVNQIAAGFGSMLPMSHWKQKDRINVQRLANLTRCAAEELSAQELWTLKPS